MAQCAARISGEVDSCSMTMPVIDMQEQVLPSRRRTCGIDSSAEGELYQAQLRHRPVALAVHRADAMLTQGGEMKRRRVAFVPVKTVLGITNV